MFDAIVRIDVRVMSSTPPTSSDQEHHRGADRTEERLEGLGDERAEPPTGGFELIDVGREIVGPAGHVEQAERRHGDHRPTDNSRNGLDVRPRRTSDTPIAASTTGTA